MKFQKIQSPWLIALLWLGLMALFTLLAMLIYWTAFSANLGSMVSLKWLQFMQSVGTFLLPALCVAYLHTDSPFSWLKMDRGMSWQTTLFAVLTMLCAAPAINLLAHLNEQMALPAFLRPLEELMRSQEEAAARLTEQFMQVDTVGGLLVNLGLMALLPALCEEVTFRGMFQSLLFPEPASVHAPLHRLTRRHHLVIWLVAAIFSFIHFQFYGFIPRLLMGAMFGYMVAWTGSLWVPMLMHCVNNAATVLSYYYVYTHGLDPNSLESIGISSTLWLGILCLIAVPAALYLFHRYIHLFSKND